MLEFRPMRWSHLFIPTLRENPAEAEVPSHQLLLRAGYVRQLSAGIYSYLFLAQRSLLKIQQIVRQEMNAIGGQEMYLPADGVHLLAHNLLDFEERALGQEQVAVDAGRKLAHVAGAQQQLMAGDLGFGGVLTQGRDEQVAPPHRPEF